MICQPRTINFLQKILFFSVSKRYRTIYRILKTKLFQNQEAYSESFGRKKKKDMEILEAWIRYIGYIEIYIYVNHLMWAVITIRSISYCNHILSKC